MILYTLINIFDFLKLVFTKEINIHNDFQNLLLHIIYAYLEKNAKFAHFRREQVNEYETAHY